MKYAQSFNVRVRIEHLQDSPNVTEIKPKGNVNEPARNVNVPEVKVNKPKE